MHTHPEPKINNSLSPQPQRSKPPCTVALGRANVGPEVEAQVLVSALGPLLPLKKATSHHSPFPLQPSPPQDLPHNCLSLRDVLFLLTGPCNLSEAAMGRTKPLVLNHLQRMVSSGFCSLLKLYESIPILTWFSEGPECAPTHVQSLHGLMSILI